MQQSGMSVTKYLQHVGINYNTYNYWRNKLPEYDENTQSYQMEWRDLVVMVEGIQESPDQRLRRLRAQRSATCRNHDVNPRDYLNDIISQMPYHTKASYEELLQLLPHKWKLTHPESVMTKTT